MTRTFLRALVALLIVSGVSLALAPYLPSAPKPAPAATPKAAPGAPARPAPPAWNEERLSGWIGESPLAQTLLWSVKLGLLLAGVFCLVHELLKADARRHGRTPEGWGPWRARSVFLDPFREPGPVAPAPGATWPTVVAEPMAALGLGVLIPFGVQVLLAAAFPPGRRPLGELEFGIAAVTIALLPPALLTALRRLRLGAGNLPRIGPALGLGVKFACIATLIVLPVQLAWGYVLLKRGEPLEVQNVVQIFADPATPAQPWLIAVFGVFVAPFTEEAVFRGLLYPALRTRAPGGPFGAAVIVALIFALIHGNLMAFVPLFTLALVLAWVMERTNSLLACVTVHALHNAASLAPMVARLLDGGGKA